MQQDILEGKNVVFLLGIEDDKFKNKFSIGKALDLKTLMDFYSTAEFFKYKVFYYKSFSSSKTMDLFHSFMVSVLGKYRYEADREAFMIPKTEDITLFTNLFDKFYEIFNDMKEEFVVYPTETETSLYNYGIDDYYYSKSRI